VFPVTGAADVFSEYWWSRH